jgi:phosphinothricin acetyltransferase
MIRLATHTDLEAITAIYNESILEGGYTGDLVPLTISSRMAWFTDHEDRYAIFVKDVDGDTVGYIALSPYRKGRHAFSGTCEISYYILSKYRGQGIGKQLIEHAIGYASDNEFSVMVAILLGCNKRSIGILKRFLFSESGRIPNAATISGASIDHVYLSRILRQ